MRPNLSVEKIAGALAVLGTGVALVGCGGSDPPAESPVESGEVRPSGSASSAYEHHCGVGFTHKFGTQVTCGSDKTGAWGSTGSSRTIGDTQGAEKPTDPTGASSATPSSTSTSTSTSTSKPGTDTKSSGKSGSSTGSAPASTGTSAPKAAPATGGKKRE